MCGQGSAEYGAQDGVAFPGRAEEARLDRGHQTAATRAGTVGGFQPSRQPADQAVGADAPQVPPGAGEGSFQGSRSAREPGRELQRPEDQGGRADGVGAYGDRQVHGERGQPMPAVVTGGVVDQPRQGRQHRVGAPRVVAERFSGEYGGVLHQARAVLRRQMGAGGQEWQPGRRRRAGTIGTVRRRHSSTRWMSW
jgi:hypothetical protein